MSYLAVNPRSTTGLWEHSNGLGAYARTGDWSWEFYPEAYGWEAPADSAPQPAPILSGLGGCGCGGKCGGCGTHSHGVGQITLFSSTDISQWGVGEWAAIAVGAFLLMKIVSGTKRTARSVKSYTRKRRKRAAAQAQALSV